MSNMNEAKAWKELLEIISEGRKANPLVPGNSEHHFESKWSWLKNQDCKYISITVDMRDGTFYLKNRHGKDISLGELKKQ